MRPDDLVKWLRATPFVPFRIRMNSGRSIDIRYPEMLQVGRTTVNVFTFIGQAADTYRAHGNDLAVTYRVR